MRSYGSRPWKPGAELEGALERGQLDFAIKLAQEVAEEGKMDLQTALRFLPLVAAKRLGDYDRWAAKWLIRWLGEASRPTIDQAAELAACLADLPAEPTVIERML